MKFNQISDKFPIENKDSFFWTIIGTLVMVIFFVLIQQKFQISKISLIALVLVGVFILRRSRRLLSDWTSDKDKIGEIDFEERFISLNKNKTQIRYEDLAIIDFRFNFIKGRNFAPKDIIHNGLAEMLLTTKSNDYRRIKFVIETKEQLEFLKSIFQQWYQSGVEIKEEFTNQKIKTICLEVVSNKSYKEIQELMNEIKKKPTIN
ncbi:MAG: hypothetical protein ACJAT4_001774 [Granulosicoccus sp.]